MFQTAPIRPTARPLPLAEDQHIDADLEVSLSTPSTLVVAAQLELADAGTHDMALSLVIPRSSCQGNRPRLAALLDAAMAAVACATRGGTLHRPRRVLTNVGGRAYLIALFDAA